MIRCLKLVVVFGAASLLAQAAVAAAPNAKLWDGTWHLNAAE